MPPTLRHHELDSGVEWKTTLRNRRKKLSGRERRYSTRREKKRSCGAPRLHATYQIYGIQSTNFNTMIVTRTSAMSVAWSTLLTDKKEAHPCRITANDSPAAEHDILKSTKNEHARTSSLNRSIQKRKKRSRFGYASDSNRDHRGRPVRENGPDMSRCERTEIGSQTARCCATSGIDVGVPRICRLGSRGCSNHEPHDVETQYSPSSCVPTCVLRCRCSGSLRGAATANVEHSAHHLELDDKQTQTCISLPFSHPSQQ